MWKIPKFAYIEENKTPFEYIDPAFKDIPCNMLDLTLLPWGFLPQRKVKELVTPDHRAHLHTKVGTQVYPESHTTEHLLELAGGEKQLCEGAEQAYLFMASKFNDMETKWSDLDVTSPILTDLFQDVLATYFVDGAAPMVKIDEDKVKAELLGIWIEEGTVDRPDKFIFRYDLEEIKYHIMSGFVGPELRLMQGKKLLGKPPRRICAAFSIKSEEAIGTKTYFLGENGEPADPNSTTQTEVWADKQQAEHFWVLETDWKSESSDPEEQNFQWRVRNINDAVVAYEGDKLPLAEVDL
eukprot:CAMPEP_0171493422 /NCGR_PEP_ID=MMETSP0958-20121227/4953_1 /TAXON_ID=87120 /ORGANISM="Aurantiochytrium limacinum, Strain ATCCMYA-1381" /LENGTH=295 /DNA_ID=CAMNT_0012027043 /DNA_START=317 /DNA_END=1204 /DNA_ORIENTATION=-